MSLNKILLVGPSISETSGLSTFLKNLMNSELNSYYNFIHVNDFFPSKSYTNKFFSSLKSLFNLSKILHSNRPAIAQIHCNSVGPSFVLKFFQVFCCKLFSVNIVTRFGSGRSFSFFRSESFFWKLAFNLFFKMQDSIIIQSPSFESFYSKFIRRDKISIIPNFVPSSSIRMLKNKRNGKLNLMFVSGIGDKQSKLKGAYLVADLFSSERSLFNDFNLFCVFPNSNFIDYCKQKDLDKKIIFVPFMSSENIHDIFCQIDVFLFLAKNESMPNTLLELLSYGVSVITTNSGSIVDIIENNKGGFIVEREDSESIIECLRKLKSEQLRLSFSKNNIARFESLYSEEVNVNKFNKIYKDLIFNKNV